MTDILANVDQLNAIDQRQIIQDLRLLAEGRKTSYGNLVPLLPRFAASHSAIVMDALFRVAGDLKKFVAPDSDAEKQLQAFFDKLSAGQLDRLGWTPKADESIDDQLTRPYILSMAL